MSESDGSKNDHAYWVRKRLRATQGARFNAFRRWQATHVSGLWATSFASVLVVAFSLRTLAFPDQGSAANLAIAATILSVATLVLGLLDSSREASVRAALLKRNAEEISSLMRDLESNLARCANLECRTNAAIQIEERYQELIGSCPYNHDTIDYKYYQYIESSNPDWRIPLKWHTLGKWRHGLWIAGVLLSFALMQ